MSTLLWREMVLAASCLSGEPVQPPANVVYVVECTAGRAIVRPAGPDEMHEPFHQKVAGFFKRAFEHKPVGNDACGCSPASAPTDGVVQRIMRQDAAARETVVRVAPPGGLIHSTTVVSRPMPPAPALSSTMPEQPAGDISLPTPIKLAAPGTPKPSPPAPRFSTRAPLSTHMAVILPQEAAEIPVSTPIEAKETKLVSLPPASEVPVHSTGIEIVQTPPVQIPVATPKRLLAVSNATTDRPRRPEPAPHALPPLDAVEIPVQAPPADAPPTSNGTPIRRTSFTETAAGRFGHADDFSWIQGELYKAHVHGGTWLVRYAPLHQLDLYGGSIVLAGDRRLDGFKEGDLVQVRGELVRDRSSIFLGGPLYRVWEIKHADAPRN